MSRQKIGVLCLFVVLSVLSIRTLLLTPGTVGHNWDWMIPDSFLHLQNMRNSLFFTWRNFSLGEPISLWLPSAPFFLFLLSFSFLGKGGEFISKFFIIFTLVVAGMGIFLLLENILGYELKKKEGVGFASFMGGFFYAFSPFLFADLIGGAATQIFAYALFPWLLFFVRRLNQEREKFFLYLLLSSLTLSLITISLQVLVLSSLTLLLYLLIQKNKVGYLKNLFLLYFCYLFLNLYWIVPTLTEYTSILQTVSGAPPFSFFTIQNLVPSLTESFIGAGYTRPFFLATIGESFLPIWFFIIYLWFVFLLGKIISNKSKESFFWLLLFLLSLIFATGGKEPLGNQVLWLYQHFPLIALFRSPQHFLVLPTFATAVLLGLAFNQLKRKTLFLRFLSLTFLFFWLYPFFLTGDLGSQLLLSKKMEHLDVFRLSPGYTEVFNFLARDKDDYKILFLPLSGSPYFLKTEYQNESQGGDPLVVYSPWDTVVADISYGTQGKNLALYLEESFCQKKNAKALSDILGMANIRYLLLRKDVIPHFSECRGWNWQEVYRFIFANSDFAEELNGDDVVLFRNKNFLPHFFATEKILSEDIFFAGKDFKKVVNEKPVISFKKLNPTKYEVSVKDVQQPYFLVFSESFNRYWKIYPNENLSGWRSWLVKPFFKNNHLKVNDFANSWFIDKTGDYDLIVEYWPQRFFYLGSFFSAFSLLALGGLFLKSFFSRR